MEHNLIGLYFTLKFTLKGWIMKLRFVLSTAVMLIAMMFAVNGCGGEGGGSSSSPQEKVTQMIPAESGGTLSLKNGISLNIPPYALMQDTNISLASVDISQFDGDSATQGGVNGLHIIGAVFEPDGTVLAEPAVASFPLPKEWTEDKTLDWYAGSGSDPLEALPVGEEITVTGTPGAYTATVRLSHFSFGMVSYNCHSGTFRNITERFIARGCTEQDIIDTVLTAYDGFLIDKEQAERTGNHHIQAFLDTYFDNPATYNRSEPISESTIAELKEYIRSGQEVVIAFSSSNTWPNRMTDDNAFYPSFPHTANLEIDENDVVQMRHTIQYNPDKSFYQERYGGLLQPEKMGPTLSYTYPLDEINEFRTKKNGELFREYVINNHPNTVKYEDFVISHQQYDSVSIYIERSEGLSQNPCADTNDDSGNSHYINFDGTVGSDISRSDIQLSGSNSFPSISWDHSNVDVYQIQVIDEDGNYLYGIGSVRNDVTDEVVPLISPMSYGDYSQPYTQKLPFYPSVSSSLVSGRLTTILLGADAGGFAQLIFMGQ